LYFNEIDYLQMHVQHGEYTSEPAKYTMTKVQPPMSKKSLVKIVMGGGRLLQWPSYRRGWLDR